MPLSLDIVSQIVNVQWGGEQFLYSGADGMFGSDTGKTWEKLAKSVPAISLAFIDDVWIGVSQTGTWKSKDGAQTWEKLSVPSTFNTVMDIIAMKPKGVDDEGKEKKGVFAAWVSEDASGDNQLVYTSHDLGDTWTVALTIPYLVGTDGNETINGISGCGDHFFVCTSRAATVYHLGDGMIYSSSDGSAFTSTTVFGPGTDRTPPVDPNAPSWGYAATAVGFDEKTRTYMAIGGKQGGAVVNVVETALIYTTSTSGSFSQTEGTIAVSASQILNTGDSIAAIGSAAAGGAGMHATGHLLSRYDGAVGFVSGDLKAGFIPGTQQQLQAMGGVGGYVASFCFNKGGSAGSTEDDSEDKNGVFGCVAFGTDMKGGIYIAKPGEAFAKTHDGTPIDIGGPGNPSPRGAVAVGKVSLEGSTP